MAKAKVGDDPKHIEQAIATAKVDAAQMEASINLILKLHYGWFKSDSPIGSPLDYGLPADELQKMLGLLSKMSVFTEHFYYDRADAIEAMYKEEYEKSLENHTDLIPE